MNEHLSTAQISEWIAGERAGESERHLRECAACRIELAGFESGLEALGQSVRYWAAQQNVAPSSGIHARVSGARASWRWALAAVVVGVMLLLPVRWSREAQREAARQADAEFLAHIDIQLSRVVPTTLEPWMNLMQQGKDEHE